MPLNKTNFPSMNFDDFEQHSCSPRILMIILKTQPLFLLIFGFLANLCSGIVLIRPRLRRRPTFSYLGFLSLTNSLLSLLHASFTILGAYFGLTLEDLSLFIFCRFLNRFAIDFLTHFSLYTLTAVDLDRIRAVTSQTPNDHRYSRGNFGNRQRGCSQAFMFVCFIELSVAIILFFINLHWLLFYGYTTYDPHTSQIITACIIPDLNNITNQNSYSIAYHRYLTSILPYIELIFFNIVPFLISLIATIVILRHVSMKYSVLNHINQRLKKSRRRMELHLSILLISLNCVFLLFTTPHTVLYLFMEKLQKRFRNPDQICTISTLQKSLDLLQQCYFMSTFFLYILTNKRFREEFCELLKRSFLSSCQIQRTSNSSGMTSSHHHHREAKKSNYLMAPLMGMIPTEYVLSDYLSQDDYLNEDASLTSRGNETSELRSNNNPPMFN